MYSVFMLVLLLQFQLIVTVWVDSWIYLDEETLLL